MKAMHKYKMNTLRCRRALASLLLFFLLFTDLGSHAFAADPIDVTVIYEDDNSLPEDAFPSEEESSQSEESLPSEENSSLSEDTLPYEENPSLSEDTLPYEALPSPSENSSPSEEDASISENSPAAEDALINALEANAILRSETADFCERYGIDTELRR